MVKEWEKINTIEQKEVKKIIILILSVVLIFLTEGKRTSEEK